MNRGIRLKLEQGARLAIFVVLCAALAAPLRAQKAQANRASAGDDFFIISSVNLKKDQLVLKRPTEVTVLMEVKAQTLCQDEKGKPLQLKDLRAGDTVFVASRRNEDGTLEATRIRKGYMTLEEVHSRYLR